MVAMGPAKRFFCIRRGMVRMGAAYLLIGNNLLERTRKDQYGRAYQNPGICKLTWRVKNITIHPNDRLDYHYFDRDLDTRFRSNSSQTDTRLYLGKGGSHLHTGVAGLHGNIVSRLCMVTFPIQNAAYLISCL